MSGSKRPLSDDGDGGSKRHRTKAETDDGQFERTKLGAIYSAVSSVITTVGDVLAVVTDSLSLPKSPETGASCHCCSTCFSEKHVFTPAVDWLGLPKQLCHRCYFEKHKGDPYHSSCGYLYFIVKFSHTALLHRLDFEVIPSCAELVAAIQAIHPRSRFDKILRWCDDALIYPEIRSRGSKAPYKNQEALESGYLHELLVITYAYIDTHHLYCAP